MDQTGGALPHAAIQIQRTKPATETPALVMTDETGVYATNEIAVGTYAISVTLDGFVPGKGNATVRANRLTDTTIVLLVRHDEVVKVPSLTIGTPNSLTAITFSGEGLKKLPDNEIQLLSFLQSLAGTRGRPGDVAIYVDGFRDFRRLPPKAAIELIQINADPYSTEFSEPGTRRIEILTKPGTDGTFGELKSEFNDESLNEREPLATSKPPLQRRSITGYFSAPIIRQKWGFYAYAGRWGEDENANIRATTLNGALEPTQVLQTISAPLRTTNVTFNTGWALGSANRLKAEYSRDDVRASNQGLEGGFALPERAHSTTNITQAARFSLLSVLGASAVYELRIQAKRVDSRIHTASSETGLVVLDAFYAGANQPLLHRDTTTDSIQVESKLTKSFSGHTWKIGFQGESLDLDQFDAGNFGGTFTFGADVERDSTGRPVVGDDGAVIPVSPLERYRRTVLGLPGYHPTLFTISTGNPTAGVRQWSASAFLQDDWIPSPALTISGGLRAETQSNITRKIDLAPRLGLTWALGTNGGTVRAGSGVFYTRLDPSVTLDTIRFDGQRQQAYVIPGPTFYPEPDLSKGAVLPTVMTKADGLRTARSWVSNIGYERKLFGPLFASVTYTYERGDRLTRLSDLNTPLTPGGSRPVPGVGEILQFQSDGASTSREWQTGLRADFASGSYVIVNYTYSKVRANTDGPRTLPANSVTLDGEFGAVDTDERHRVFLSGTLALPRLWMLIPTFTYGTPRPFNITTGLDNNSDGHLTDRPSFASPDDPQAIATPFGLLNPNPKPGETIIPRNFGRGGRVMRFDLSLAKVFLLQDPARGRRTLSFHVTAKNLLNTGNYRDFNGVLLSPTFGRPNAAQPARQVSIGLGFSF